VVVSMSNGSSETALEACDRRPPSRMGRRYINGFAHLDCLRAGIRWVVAGVVQHVRQGHRDLHQQRSSTTHAGILGSIRPAHRQISSVPHRASSAAPAGSSPQQDDDWPLFNMGVISSDMRKRSAPAALVRCDHQPQGHQAIDQSQKASPPSPRAATGQCASHYLWVFGSTAQPAVANVQHASHSDHMRGGIRG